ncbi:hypothetical protein GDO81_011912 [Engystomops pustulosus]|uniref:Olfactory receptor n=1 Tax=Engystomops pustulosus TaxID=76066 RepID=A0AAV7BHM3_ENGPU|nr:hypothetical protein GDO81_011912 [Engystomops pustulosus]
MSSSNQTTIEGFRLKGFSYVPELQILISLLVIFIYLLSLGGNLIVLLLVCLDVHLHTPMYFFLSNLSVIDIVSSTTTLHRIFFMTQYHMISYSACLAQVYIFCSLVSSETSVLAAMSYDRYVAICRPLHYHIIMSRILCALLATVTWGFAFIEMIPVVVLISRFTCYISKEIDHYFCDALPIRDITCSDTSVLDFYVLTFGTMNVFILLLLTIIPYAFIITCVLRVRSSGGRRKAFYTCSSHIMVVVIFYSSIILQYIVTISGSSMGSNKIFSLLNTAVVPMLNPLIYSLKNKHVKSALRRKLKKLLL